MRFIERAISRIRPRRPAVEYFASDDSRQSGEILIADFKKSSTVVTDTPPDAFAAKVGAILELESKL